MGQEIVVRPMGHGLPKCRTTHGSWARKLSYDPWAMGQTIVVRPMGHGPDNCRTASYGPWVMGNCHVVWPMGHGKKVAEGALDEAYRPETSSCGWSRISDAFLVSEASAATPVPPFRSVLELSSICLEDPSQRSATGDGLCSTTTHLSRNHENQFRTHLRILQEAATRSVELGVSTLSHTAAACLVICRILQEN